MAQWKIEKLGIDSRQLQSSGRTEAHQTMGVKWRYSNRPQAKAPVVEKTEEAPVKEPEEIKLSTPAFNEGVLKQMEIEELKAVAGQLGISKISKASKEELISAILGKQG